MDAGAQAVVVSNHGGRQLDGVPATLRALPEVLDAVNGRIEVLMDGGIRSWQRHRQGESACGAKAVLVGRAYAWALGAAVVQASPAPSRFSGPTSSGRCAFSDAAQSADL
jgi:isopentenyl diphosphate isomerase/L-lactate dehydrogenase-like FMN-dependent dehydrogenase